MQHPTKARSGHSKLLSKTVTYIEKLNIHKLGLILRYDPTQRACGIMDHITSGEYEPNPRIGTRICMWIGA